MAVLRLDELDHNQIDTAGGKGANLGELIKSGFPVPPGFVISAGVYSEFISDFDIPSNDELEDQDSFLADIQKYILDTELSNSTITTITEHHQYLLERRSHDIVYAVRSSATAEDLADASFAGQHETYYYVEPDNLSLMIRKCWASLWSEAAFSYRQSQGIEHRSVHMAVVVQEMVRSEVSGVTFTADPVSGSQSVIVTESSWGMGAAIVDGRVSPDQYLVDKTTGRLTSIKISDKKFMVPARISADQPSRLMEVPANLRRKESLNDEQVAEIARLAALAEDHFQSPQDLEWAIADNEVFLLQSRPITIMGNEEEDELPEGKYILFKPLAENFTDPLMPLTGDILSDMVPMMTLIHGRAYLNFKHVRALVPLKISEADLARLAYLSDPVEDNIKVSVPRVIGLIIALYMNYLGMGVFNRRTAGMPDDFMDSYRSYVDQVVDDESLTPPDAMLSMFLRYGFFEPAGHMVMLANLVAPRYIVMLQMINQLLARWTPDLPQDSASLLTSGTPGILSTDMGRQILGLAKIAKSNPQVASIIRDQEADSALMELRQNPNGQDFIQALEAFLAKHGHRALKEFELSSKRWEEDPAPVIGMVRNYLLIDSDLDAAEADTQQQRLTRLNEIKLAVSKLPFEFLGKPRQRLLNLLVEQARYYIKLRENSRFYHILGFYGIRRKLLRIEARLLERGSLKCKDDIFYLHWQEIDDLDHGKLGWTDVEDLIRGRRMMHIRRSKMTPPKTVGIDLEEEADTATDGLSGQGASPGTYEGIARVIMDPGTDNKIEPGEILVAPYTDPAWTPLFLTAHAAVVEVGSYLSHAGTIAREYGMPCVVDVANCTSRIKSGDRIRVDGSLGHVGLIGEST